MGLKYGCRSRYGIEWYLFVATETLLQTGHGNTAELYQGRVYYIAPQDRDRFKDSLYQCLHVVWYDQNATSLRWEVSLVRQLLDCLHLMVLMRA